MKHSWTVAALALFACAGLATPAWADGQFGLFYNGRHCNKCAVCIRPYNAFTPVLCGDVTGYGGCGQGGCGQGGYGPIGCPCPSAYGCGQGGCGYGCGQGGCGQGNCGQGNCGQGGCGQGGCGYGCGQGGCGYGCGKGGCGWAGCGYGWSPHHGMANVNPLRDTGYTGALGYNPPDGLGNGAFGTVGLGRLSVFGNPGCGGGCCAGGACAGGACKANYSMPNTFAPAPMACGPQGCAPNYGFGMDFAAPTFAAPAAPAEVKPALVPVPTKPETKQVPQARSSFGYPTQPVSYVPAYPMSGQQMPYGYTQPAWGYYGYPAWGYQGW